MSSHDDGHVERVVRIARLIAEAEGADVDVVVKAAELHDIARECENHAAKSAEIAEELLKKEGYDAEFIESVKHAILSHSFSSGVKAETLEAKVLSDADKLDAMGAIGVARAFSFGGERGRSLDDTLRHFEEKLLRLKDVMYTETGRRIAEKRHRFLVEFYNRMKGEMELRDVLDEIERTKEVSR